MKNSRTPMRRCLGCMESKPKNQLIRIAYNDSKIEPDFVGTATGRGAYVCKSEKCFEQAEKKNAFNRAFRSRIDQESIRETRRKFSEYIENEDVLAD